MRAMILAALIITAANSTSSAASTVTREATYAEISRAMTEINERLPAKVLMDGAKPSSTTRALLDFAVQRVSDLQDYLKDNPYVRVRTFSVGIPSGVSVEFEYLPITDAKQ